MGLLHASKISSTEHADALSRVADLTSALQATRADLEAANASIATRLNASACSVELILLAL